ncbi:S-layer homology domain-containing protein [Paenibacillus harenae]|uniref:S-layer homology domain-containing protein n=1 Tax=Paenibacillus harenae TaxID=306543 RepID=UPI000402B75A|nr:S-layer homology domain-containing protein [Paenibacillus harenae]
MRKTVFIILSALLLLTGCVSNAPIFTEAFKKGIDVTSFESKSTVTIDTNVPVQDDELKRVLQVLKSGVIIAQQQKDLQNAHMEISLQDPTPIMGTELWPSAKKPALDVYIQGSDLYVKSTADNKFLGIENETSEQSQAEVTAQMKKFMEEIVKQNPFTLRHVDILGEETVTLPNGSSETATHVRITMEFKEMVDVLISTLENLSKSPDLDNQLKSIFGEIIPTEDLETGTSVKDELSNLVKELKAVNAEELKAAGWDVDFSLDTWINSDKEFDQTDAVITVHAPASVLSEAGVAEPQGLKTIYFTLKLHSQSWNQNQSVTYTVPPADQVITVQQLEKDPELVTEFGEESLIGRFAAAMAPVEEQPPFADVSEDHWANGPIMVLRDSGIVNGYANNEFKPNQSITRSEFITMTVKALGLEPEKKNLTFTDKNQIPAWSEEYWQTAVQAGIINGYEDGTLKPNQKISRAEMIAILIRGLDEPLQNGYKLNYKDTKEIPAWAIPYVKTATVNGIVQGSSDNRFAPHKNASRAEVAMVLFNVMIGVE